MRDIQTDYANARTMADAKSWISVCLKSHQDCATKTSIPMPSRILRISKDGKSVVLIPSNGQTARYVALSYPWGGNIDFVTTKSSLEDRSKPFPTARLPQTIQDAVAVSLEVSVRSLWVDSLCIVQDSDEDKAQEISKMDEIYQNAFLTISATNALSAYSGFLGHKYCDTVSQRLPLMYPNWAIGYCFVREKWWRQEEPLNQRAWALQERYLCRRLLDYTSIGLMKICRQENLSDRPREAWESSNFHERLSRVLNAESGSRKFEYSEALQAWDTIIGLYTKRLLTNRQDKLPALGGLARRFQKHLGSDYVAGLWREFLPQGLLWYGHDGFHEVRFREKVSTVKRPEPYRAPSWSWASVDGHLHSKNGRIFNRSYDESSEKIEITLQVLQCKVRLANPTVPFGEVTGGMLQVNGHVRDVICRPSSLRKTELEVASIRLQIQPDDFREWSEALKGTVVSLLEIVRHSEQAGSTLNETTLYNFWQGSEAVRSVGLMLVQLPNNRYRRLGYFKEIEMKRRKYLFEKCSRRTVLVE